MSIGNAGSNTTAASSAEVSNLLVQGFKAAKEGRRDEAYDIFCNVVRRDPNNELGWLYRAATTQDLSEAYVCLQRVLNINPANEKAQRGVERIQTRLSADSSNRTLASNGGSTAAAIAPAIEEKDVISGFNSGFKRNSAPVPEAPSAPAQRPRYPYQEAASPFNQAQPAPAVEETKTPPPYRPDFGQLNSTPDAIDRPPTAQIRATRPTPPPYIPSFTPAREDEVGDYEDMVDEPVYTGPVGSQRENTASRRPHLVEGLASARQRGRAAFGTDTPTDLDRNGQRRSRQIFIPLIIVGIVLVLIALVILLLPIFKPASDTATPTSSVAVSATTSAVSVPTNTPGNRPATTAAAAVTVPVVGATTAAASTTSAASTTAVATTVAATIAAQATTVAGTATPNATAAAIIGVTPAATTQAAAPTAAPPATQAPPPATTAPPAPALPRATVYIIKGGDNLTRIASQYSTSIEAIQAANPGLQANTIFAGNRVVVPVSRPDFRGKGAIINANETLQTIADRYKVSVDDLARFNGYATPADAKPGDAVLVP